MRGVQRERESPADSELSVEPAVGLDPTTLRSPRGEPRVGRSAGSLPPHLWVPQRFLLKCFLGEEGPRTATQRPARPPPQAAGTERPKPKASGVRRLVSGEAESRPTCAMTARSLQGLVTHGKKPDTKGHTVHLEDISGEADPPDAVTRGLPGAREGRGAIKCSVS